MLDSLVCQNPQNAITAFIRESQRQIPGFRGKLHAIIHADDIRTATSYRLVNSLEFPVDFDLEGKFARSQGLAVVPALLVVDASERIIAAESPVGGTGEDWAAARSRLERFLRLGT